MTRAMRTATIAIAVLTGWLGLAHGQAGSAGPAATPTKVQYADHAMGTNVTVWMWTADERGAAQAAEAVFDEMKRLDKEMTTWLPTSEVSQINAAAGGKPV
ncbi:MAG: FAD:protein FMN transferase, partial [Kofleriaceae bacterium]